MLLIYVLLYIQSSYQCFVFGCAATVIADRETGRSRGFGFVSFSCEDSANNAIKEMDGKVRKDYTDVLVSSLLVPGFGY